MIRIYEIIHVVIACVLYGVFICLKIIALDLLWDFRVDKNKPGCHSKNDSPAFYIEMVNS